VEEHVPETLALQPDAVRESHVAATQTQRLPVEAFGVTDTGQRRAANEDSFAVVYHHGLFMVADGMGGRNAGEVASKMAIDCVREAFESVDTTWPSAAGEDPGRMPSARLLIAGIQRANSRIVNLARRESDKSGMGTTFAGILVLQARVVIAHVGDSRVYRLRAKQLDQLTEDHSLLNEYIREGRWDPAEADAFPRPEIITRAVGADDELEVDTRIDAPVPGDVYLICSDGLSNMLDRPELAAIMLKYRDITQCGGKLIDAANRRGGSDNITAVLVRVG
jgi:serine/threonine protein phosphatase PrpC